MFRIHINRRIAIAFYVVAAGLVFSTVLSTVESLITPVSFLGNYLAILIILFSLIWIKNCNASRNIKAIFAIGYILYVVSAVVQNFFPYLLPDSISNSDQTAFLRIANEYYRGNFSDYSTNMPYLVYYLYKIFGCSTFILRILSVECVLLGCYLLTRIKGHLCGKRDTLFIAFYMLMPWNILIYGQILRDSYKMFLLMLCMFCLLKWMETGKLFSLLLAIVFTAPLLWLHNGEIGILVIILFAYVLWNPKRRKWILTRPNWKNGLIVLGVALLPEIYYLLFQVLFPGKFNGTFSLQSLLVNSGAWVDARTVYVPQVSIESVPQFIYWTIYRSFYFWFSPTPKFWSSKWDAVMFAVDSIPWALFYLVSLFELVLHKFEKRRYLIIPFFMIFTFIYAWGTLNAGTAMRHRDHMIGVLVMLSLLNNKEEKNSVVR